MRTLTADLGSGAILPFCAYCGTEVPLGMRACPECGHPQAPASIPSGIPSGLPGAFADVFPVGPKRNEPLAVASLVTGISGLVICPVIGSILGIAFGLTAHRRIDRDATKTGKGLATGGIVTGALGVLVIPIIVAIAIPVFLRARSTVEDTFAEAALNNAVQTVRTIARPAQSYRAVNAQSLASAGTGLTWAANGESAGPTIVSYVVVDETEIRVAVLSESGKCLGARDDVDGTGVTFATHQPGRQCNAGAFSPEEFVPSPPSTQT